MDSIASSIDVEDFIQTKDDKQEIEDKVARILKLIKTNDEDKKGKVPEDSMKRSELVGLIQDLHKQYQALNEHYDRLKGEMENNLSRARVKKEKGKSFSSSSTSESDEYYSSEEIENVRQRTVSEKNSKNFPDDALKHLLLVKPPENQGFVGKSPRSARNREVTALLKLQEARDSAQIKELEGQVNVLRMELESERELKIVLENKIKDKEKEAINLKLESEKKGNEISVMKEKMEESVRKFKNLEMEKAEVSEKVEFLKQELEIKTLKLSETENLKDELVKERENCGMQMEELKLEMKSLQKENKNLESRIAEINKIQVETEIPKLPEEEPPENIQEHKLTKHKSMDFAKLYKSDSNRSLTQQKTSAVSLKLDYGKLNQNILERKIDELAEKFEMNMENHIKLLSRRIRIAEQIHVETMEKLYQENKAINEKKANYEAEVKKMKEMLLKQGSNILSRMEIMVRKFDEQNQEFIIRISRIIKEVDNANLCIVKKGDEMKKLKCSLENANLCIVKKGDEMKKLKCSLENEKIMLKQKVGKMQEELNGVGLEKENKIEDLEKKLKEKDEMILIVGDEKREAIKQLCVLIDYHRNRYDHLKDTVAKMPIKFKKSD